MKTKSKALAISLCAILLVIASVMGTMAYLTSTDEVTNTFTVGKVTITLDEAPVDGNGKVVSGDRVKKNEYKLLPGHEYDKDPTVHVAANSEACYLFVKVENGIKDIIADKTIEAQIIENDWIELVGVDNVYYMKISATSKDPVDKIVFSGFTISDDVKGQSPDYKNDEEKKADSNLYLSDYQNKKITVTAYAIQADGFDSNDNTELENATAAWIAGGWN